MKDAQIFAFGIDHAGGIGLGRFEDRPHEQPGLCHELFEGLPIGIQIGDRARGDPGFGGGPGDRRGNAQDQPGVERFRNQIVGPKAQFLPGVR